MIFFILCLNDTTHVRPINLYHIYNCYIQSRQIEAHTKRSSFQLIGVMDLEQTENGDKIKLGTQEFTVDQGLL